LWKDAWDWERKNIVLGRMQMDAGIDNKTFWKQHKVQKNETTLAEDDVGLVNLSYSNHLVFF
jgi:hypothetical protein